MKNKDKEKEAPLPNACNFIERDKQNTFLQRKTKDMKEENH